MLDDLIEFTVHVVDCVVHCVDRAVNSIELLVDATFGSEVSRERPLVTIQPVGDMQDQFLKGSLVVNGQSVEGFHKLLVQRPVDGTNHPAGGNNDVHGSSKSDSIIYIGDRLHVLGFIRFQKAGKEL